ncbi:hypothetical protein GLOIN_2v1846618 [Rhizophagus irregularis DAOM 181602=DAOM 197198]|nr:hypothetical protein GLOIN_2v1846618 [Rhizophagus irregularis DAOM 181602=DAOM 197198]
MSMDKGRTPNGAAIDFVSEFQDIFFETISQHLGTFIQDGFLKDLYEKKPTTPVDKAQMLIDRFGESANPQKFIEQARSLNIQPTTLSLIFSIALSAASRSWDNFTTHFYMEFGDMGDEVDPNLFDESEDDEWNAAELGSQLSELGVQTPNPALDSPPVSLLSGKELKWCQHSIPNLKKARKLKTKKTLDTKTSGKAGKVPVSNKSKKKDQVSSSTSNKKNENQLKDPRAQKKAKKTSKSKDRDKGNQVVLAEILSLLRRLV